MPWKYQGSRPLILKQLMAGQAGKTGINCAICYQIATKLNEWDRRADSWGTSPSRCMIASFVVIARSAAMIWEYFVHPPQFGNLSHNPPVNSCMTRKNGNYRQLRPDGVKGYAIGDRGGRKSGLVTHSCFPQLCASACKLIHNDLVQNCTTGPLAPTRPRPCSRVTKSTITARNSPVMRTQVSVKCFSPCSGAFDPPREQNWTAEVHCLIHTHTHKSLRGHR